MSGPTQPFRSFAVVGALPASKAAPQRDRLAAVQQNLPLRGKRISAPPPGGGRLQVFGAGALPAERFSAAFFFCLGFLASRLDRFCSLFATRLSFTRTLRRNMRGSALNQPRNLEADRK